MVCDLSDADVKHELDVRFFMKSWRIRVRFCFRLLVSPQ